MQIGARNFLLVEFNQDILFERLVEEELVLTLRAITPEDILRFGEELYLMHPVEDRLIFRFPIADPFRGRNSGRDVLHIDADLN